MPWVAVSTLLSVNLPVAESWKAPTATATVGISSPSQHVDGERHDAEPAGAAARAGGERGGPAGPRDPCGSREAP